MIIKDRGQLLAVVKSNGFKGKTFEDLEQWMTEKGFTDITDENGSVDIKSIWAKGVVITVSGDATADGTTVTDDSESEDPQTLEAMEDEDEDEEEETQKSFKPEKKSFRQKQREDLDAYRATGQGAHRAVGKAHFAVHTKDSAIVKSKKMYDRAAAEGGLYKGAKPVFSCAEEVEYFGAASRLMLTRGGQRPYDGVREDLGIIGKTAGSTYDNAWAGTLIVSETAPQIIDLLHQYGATRQCVPVTDMPDGVFDVKRKTANMSFAFVDENTAPAETNPTYDNVELVAKTMAGISKLSREMLNDSAFSLGEEVAKASAAGASYFEDTTYFNGTNGTWGGLAGAIDSDSTYDAALSSNWGDYTIEKLQNWVAKVPVEAMMSGTVKIACSSAFYFAVLRRFALSAGGNTGASILDGVGGGYAWDGIPVVLTQVLPSTYSADQTVAYIGSFERGTKFGVVRGSEQLLSSEERYWDTRQFAWMYESRINNNFHDVGGTSSEVIALKD